jgi:hypothetical protein
MNNGGMTMKAMIALVSDQRMQNVFPILQEGAKYSNLVLVLSKSRDTGKPLERYVASANDLKAVLSPFTKVLISDTYVDPYDIRGVQQTIESLIRETGNLENIVINISGGTKPMAIGAFRAAQSTGVECVYTNTEDGELLWFSPDGSIHVERIRVCKIDVLLYIRAYGETVASSRAIADLDPKEVQQAKIIAENHEILYTKVINPINSKINKGHGPPFCHKITPTRRQRIAILDLANTNCPMKGHV